MLTWRGAPLLDALDVAAGMSLLDVGAGSDEFRAAYLDLYVDINQATDGSLRYEGEYLEIAARKSG